MLIINPIFVCSSQGIFSLFENVLIIKLMNCYLIVQLLYVCLLKNHVHYYHTYYRALYLNRLDHTYFLVLVYGLRYQSRDF